MRKGLVLNINILPILFYGKVFEGMKICSLRALIYKVTQKLKRATNFLIPLRHFLSITLVELNPAFVGKLTQSNPILTIYWRYKHKKICKRKNSGLTSLKQANVQVHKFEIVVLDKHKSVK
jgi:hypothetical protein